LGDPAALGRVAANRGVLARIAAHAMWIQASVALARELSSTDA
jgi:hypothetical protein